MFKIAIAVVVTLIVVGGGAGALWSLREFVTSAVN